MSNKVTNVILKYQGLPGQAEAANVTTQAPGFEIKLEALIGQAEAANVTTQKPDIGTTDLTTQKQDLTNKIFKAQGLKRKLEVLPGQAEAANVTTQKPDVGSTNVTKQEPDIEFIKKTVMTVDLTVGDYLNPINLTGEPDEKQEPDVEVINATKNTRVTVDLKAGGDLHVTEETIKRRRCEEVDLKEDDDLIVFVDFKDESPRKMNCEPLCRIFRENAEGILGNILDNSKEFTTESLEDQLKILKKELLYCSNDLIEGLKSIDYKLEDVRADLNCELYPLLERLKKIQSSRLSSNNVKKLSALLLTSLVNFNDDPENFMQKLLTDLSGTF